VFKFLSQIVKIVDCLWYIVIFKQQKMTADKLKEILQQGEGIEVEFKTSHFELLHFLQCLPILINLTLILA
jgi:hypothetical protein